MFRSVPWCQVILIFISLESGILTTVEKKAMDLFVKKCKVRNNLGFIPFISNFPSTAVVYQLWANRMSFLSSVLRYLAIYPPLLRLPFHCVLKTTKTIWRIIKFIHHNPRTIKWLSSYVLGFCLHPSIFPFYDVRISTKKNTFSCLMALLQSQSDDICWWPSPCQTSKVSHI